MFPHSLPSPSTLLGLATFLLFSTTGQAATPDDWRSRSIYQVITDRFWRSDGSTKAPCDVNEFAYCGGSWAGITDKLDYIQRLGFDSIWISPVTKNVDRGYHGYWQSDLYSVNEHFGTPDELKSLSDALHDRGMYLMVDVVINHFGSKSSESPDCGKYFPFDSDSYFHSYCNIDQSDTECWLDHNLADVRTEDKEVQEMYASWITGLVSNYSIDGLRIDSVLNVDQEAVQSFCKAADIFCLGEVYNGNPSLAYPYQTNALNGGGILSYPMWYVFWGAFVENGARTAHDLAYAIQENAQYSADANLHGIFVENHDNPRLASENDDISIAKNAIAWTMLNDGIPVIFQGQEQHLNGGDDPGNREAMWLGSSGSLSTDSELYEYTARMNKIRKIGIAATEDYLFSNSTVLEYTDNQFPVRKGALRTIFTWAGTGQASGTFTTDGAEFSASASVVDLVSCKTYKATSGGEVTANTGAGAVVVLIESGAVGESDICSGMGGYGSTDKTY